MFLNFKTAYIEMQDLLRDFEKPAVMDIKMGTRYVCACVCVCQVGHSFVS